jgi:hypothetical protein
MNRYGQNRMKKASMKLLQGERKMNTRKIFASIAGYALIVLLGVAAGGAFASQESGAPPPPMFPMHGSSGISADQQYLYVMAAGKIMEYSLTDMTLIKSVDLPDPGSPPSPPTEETESGMMPPPPRGGSHGLCAIESNLYVLAGHVVYRYSTPDLTLQGATELPAPGLPAASGSLL